MEASNVTKVAALMLVIGAGIGGYIIGEYRADCERRLAVQAGCGRYVADPATGRTQFVYLAPEGP
jgi:hypothetical protein